MERILTAALVWTGTGESLVEGKVRLSEGKIAETGKELYPTEENSEQLSLENCVLLPGLVNAHSHLDLSHLRGKIPFDGSFVEWLKRVAVSRLLTRKGKVRKSLEKAVGEAIRTGTTCFGDIAAHSVAIETLRELPIRARVFLEVLGFTEDRVEKARTWIEKGLSLLRNDPLHQPGLSPHSPYSVGDALFGMLRERDSLNRLPMAIHAAEVLDEAAMLEGGFGPLHDAWKRIGFLPKGWEPPGLSPIEFLADRGFLRPGVSLIHANFLAETDLDLLEKAQASGPVSIVHCPGSHAYFRRLRFPVSSFLDRRIPVVLGTDSLASNASLDMSHEMRLFHRTHPDVPPETVLRMVTKDAATAIGYGETCGTLEAGKAADLIAIRLPGIDPKTWAARFLSGEGEVVLTMIDGRIVHRV